MASELEFLFDYASPFSYLASELLPRRLPQVGVRYRPIYLRGLETFAGGVPFVANKLRYLLHDLMRSAEREEIAVRLPSEFPINGLQACRGALAALEQGGFERYHGAMFRAAWADDRAVARAEVVLEVAVEAGLDRERFAACLASPATKERLRAETAEAEARGVFGAPSFFVGEELFWGCDRLDQVGRALAASRETR